LVQAGQQALAQTHIPCGPQCCCDDHAALQCEEPRIHALQQQLLLINVLTQQLSLLSQAGLNC
jgi:hypothetical protein